MGRRKIEMKMVKDNNCRQVTFSKRRTGLFKKANELATLCGADVAIVVFSPGGKPFSFGNPSVGSVSARFLSTQDPNANNVNAGSSKGVQANRLDQRLMDLFKQLEAEKKRGEMLEKAMKAKGQEIFERPIKELSLHELETLKGSLEELRENLRVRISELEASSSLLLLGKRPVQEDDAPDSI